MPLEYAPFGEGWVCREKGSADNWQPCALDDLPADVVAARVALLARLERIALHGYDPEDPPRQFAVITRAEDRRDL